MPLNPQVRICSHIKVNGVKCGSPALSGEKFCYFHQRMIRGVPTPSKSRIHPMAILENEESIQVALMETVNAVVRNQIDLPRAHVILRALNIAARNAKRIHFDCFPLQMVRRLPEPNPAEPAAVPEQIASAEAQPALIEAGPVSRKPAARVTAASLPEVQKQAAYAPT